MRNIGADRTVSVERVWGAAWGAAAPSRQSSAAVAARITLCPEAVVILLGTVRALIHTEQGSLPDWLSDHPVAIIQVCLYLSASYTYVSYSGYILVYAYLTPMFYIHVYSMPTKMYVCKR